MSTTVSLDSIRESAEARFGSYIIDCGESSVELVNPVRLPRERREALFETLRSAAPVEGADGEKVVGDGSERLRSIVRLGAKSKAQGETLLRLVGDDLAVLRLLVDGYLDTLQVGEASPSGD